ncbi:MAG: signal recognition particle subunit SRP19/SEC65 family protein [Candidatus Helarchaeota archaeon]
MRNKRQHHIYPVYFDSKRSWKQGRRVKKKLAVEAPTIQELAQAAAMLDLPMEVNLEVKYPRFWWLPSGRLQIKKQEGMNKNKLIKKLAIQLKKVRGKR